ncbi:hypothetical protein H103_02707 [Trichophyton rubrum CBS 288.86]|uniref:Uncharacterized protein n=2 Tax=Trichophyton TaxID=5550 RepID=A0A022W8W2_TRIRU|nr:hypothetical protein H103_02707 [Trichophyton rubrum CBS 288.86]EZF75747.1 hypothetical protein H105_02713 [Trichophyton soudanense CBS 452.61]EZF86441.1 hypothetical protein H110_02705 [Trichophyton rubrum MR1448]EZG09303.1 hypothetical protein H106_01529 [Trichophyton rubrum CBS 735.88]
MRVGRANTNGGTRQLQRGRWVDGWAPWVRAWMRDATDTPPTMCGDGASIAMVIRARMPSYHRVNLDCPCGDLPGRASPTDTSMSRSGGTEMRRRGDQPSA